jgi:hypothetical protein
MTKEKNQNLPSKEDIKKFKMLYPMVESDLYEIRELSKKKQDEPLNKFKVKTINKKLLQVKEILINEPTNDYIELLDDDTFPSNSDAVLMISQFIKALDQYEIRYYSLLEGSLDLIYLTVGKQETNLNM